MFKSYPVRAFVASSLLAFVTSPARAQQPTDLDKLVAPIADAISRSGKHKVCVLPLLGPDDKYTELGLSLAKRISATLAATVPGFQEIEPPVEKSSSESGQQSYSPAAIAEIGRKSGAEVIVSGSFSFFETGLGVTLSVSEVGEKKFPTLLNGLLSFTADIPRPPEQSVSSSQGEPKTYSAGEGGVGLPRCIHCPDPNYPESLRSKQREGIVTLQIVVGTDGRVSRIQVVKASGAEFADLAMSAAKKFRFEPAKGPDGRPVPVLVNYEVTFRLLP
jgi:TonB family protein